MRKLIKFQNKNISFVSHGAVGGFEEAAGPLGENFDLVDKTDLFGMKSYEMAEGEMGRLCVNIAMTKAGFKPTDIDCIFAGDLQNQCFASSSGLYSFGIPYIGLYSACSTMTEALLLGASLIDGGHIKCACALSTSHNSAAERQFRTPLEYGGQRQPYAQWTATAAGAFILDGEGQGRVRIKDGMIGKIVDGLTTDAANMGAAMARSAMDTIYTYFSLSDISPTQVDLIVTGDLGYVGSEMLRDMLGEQFPALVGRHIDCGTLLYDRSKKDVHAGASGCGCSASVLSLKFIPQLERGELKNILFMSTGALMNPTGVLQKNNILGITPLVRLSSE